MKQAKSRPVCGYCEEPYGKRITTEHTFFVADGEPDPPEAAVVAEGQHSAFKETRTPWFASDGKVTEIRVRRTFWDGESYSTPYEPFCTLRCGLEFAIYAWNGGIR